MVLSLPNSLGSIGSRRKIIPLRFAVGGTPAPGGFGRVRRKEHRLDFLPQIIRISQMVSRGRFLHLSLLEAYLGL